MSFSKNDLNSIKEKVSIRLEIEKKTKVIQKGKDYWCCCPFHEEKTPSCKINEELGTYYCFGCGAKGDIFSIYTDLYNYKFIDALKELSQKAGVKIDFNDYQKSKKENIIENILELSCLWFHNNLQKSSAKNCNEYLNKRKLTKETINVFKLGFSFNSDTSLYQYLKSKSFKDEDILTSNVIKIDRNNKIRDYFYKRLIFPIRNTQGKVVGFGGRALDDSNPKYINSPESKFFQKRYLLYNLDIAKNSARKKNNLLICEGYMDVISLYQNGIFSVVAPLGTALTEEQLNLSWNYSSKPTIMFDGDNAGIRASYKTAIMALPIINNKNFLQFATLPSEYDPDSYINKFSFKEFVEYLKNPESLIQFIFEHSSKTISLNNADEKISYDKYLDDLIETIKDSKTKYFYKSEFKSLFFNKIRNLGISKKQKNKVFNKREINLNEKQNLSFISSAINNLEFREKIIEALFRSKILDKKEMDFLDQLRKKENIKLRNDEIIQKFGKEIFEEIIKNSTSPQIYQLFPYSSPLFDPQDAYEEIIKSINNLNTRLSNLKKINKSLDTFVKNSNTLNWNELQSINNEITNDD